MITYLLKSTLCLLLAWGFYKIGLENERMHRFKRYYLMGSLLFSLCAPLIPTDNWLEPLVTWPVQEELAVSKPVQIDEAILAAQQHVVVEATAPVDQGFPYGWVLYGLITAIFFIRFGRNLYTLIKQIQTSPKRSIGGAVLVRASGPGLPYTFWHYLFVDEPAFDLDTLKSELLTHELAHARQRHTLDVLLIELLLCVAWFNPLLFAFRRAIKLNHEFLADEAVNQNTQQVSRYQHLILEQLTQSAPIPLTSMLTFQTTKQRFKMMTKHTSVRKVWVTGMVAVTLLGLLPLLLGNATTAQTPAPSAKPGTLKPAATNKQQTAISDSARQRFADKIVLVYKKGTPFPKKVKYSALSADEQKRVMYLPPSPRKTPTEAQLNEWKNPKKFGVWVNNKRVRNFAATSYKASDIASFSGTYVHKNARQPEGYLYQIDLMTNDYYADYLKRKEENPLLTIPSSRM